MGKANNKTKTDNFLKAIKKYSELEREQIEKDFATLKEEEVVKAEKKGEKAAKEYVTKQYSVSKSAVTGEYAAKNLDAQNNLYKRREEITESVFSKAKEKLSDFTTTDEYKQLLLKYAKEIAEIFNDNACVICLKNSDLKYADEIKAVFAGEVSVEEDETITIGGIKGNCKALKILADNTLDSKLEQQKPWFTENSNLKVM